MKTGQWLSQGGDKRHKKPLRESSLCASQRPILQLQAMVMMMESWKDGQCKRPEARGSGGDAIKNADHSRRRRGLNGAGHLAGGIRSEGHWVGDSTVVVGGRSVFPPAEEAFWSNLRIKRTATKKRSVRRGH